MYQFLRLFIFIYILVAVSCAVTKTTTVKKSTATAKATSNGGTATAIATAKTKVITTKTAYTNSSNPEYGENNNYNNTSGCGECDGARQSVINAANSFTFHYLNYLRTISDESDDIAALPLNGFGLLCYSAVYSYGETWEEAKAFCGAQTKEQLKCSLEMMHSFSFNPPNGINYMYGANFVNNYDVTEEFKRGLEQTLGAMLRRYYYWEPLKLTRKINQFIAEATNNKVRKAITKPSLFRDDPNARRAVFATGLYFKGQWQQAFDTSNLTIREYYDSQNNVIRVPYIYQKTIYNYTCSTELDIDVLSIPFVDGFYNCVVIIPRNKCSNLDELIEKLMVPETYSNLVANLKPACIEYIAPFYARVEAETDLGEGLKSTGKLDTFFDGKLSMFETAYGKKLKGLYLGGARQKTVIINTLSGIEPPSNECPYSENLEEYTIVADHPVIVTIESQGLIRFINMGKVTKLED